MQMPNGFLTDDGSSGICITDYISFKTNNNKNKGTKLFDFGSPPFKEAIDTLVVWNNKLVAGGITGVITVFNSREHQEMILEGHTNRVVTLCVWNDWLVSRAMDHTIRIWDVNGKCLKVLPEATQFRGCNQLVIWKNRLVSFARDLDADGVLHLYNTKLQFERNILLHQVPIKSVAVWNDRLVCGHADGTMRILNAEDERWKLIIGHRGFIVNLTVSNTNYIEILLEIVL
jgi:WD40 repeat protein